MALRFQRRIRIVPGLHLNLSKRGVGFSAGPRGFPVGIDLHRRPDMSTGIPGTGLSWREYAHQRPPGVHDRSGCGLPSAGAGGLGSARLHWEPLNLDIFRRPTSKLSRWSLMAESEYFLKKRTVRRISSVPSVTSPDRAYGGNRNLSRGGDLG